MSAEVRQNRSPELLNIIRPMVRGDCEPCPVCQAVRDGGMVSPGVLPCGHTDDEVIWHSRPCIFVGCRQNLYLDVTENGSLKMTRPELDPEEMRQSRSCVLDVAANGPLTLDDVGWALDVSRERIRQLEVRALSEFRTNGEPAGIDEDAIRDVPEREQGFERAGDEGDGRRR